MEPISINCGYILHPRFLKSVLWTILLHIFPLALYTAVLNATIFHPFLWASSTVGNVFNIRNLLSLLPLYVLFFFMGASIQRDYTKCQRLNSSRFRIFMNVFSKTSLVRAVSYFCCGVLLPFIYVRLYSDFLLSCETNGRQHCINEPNVFVYCCGIWCSFYYFLHEAFSEKSIKFPVIQQVKFLQIRNHFSPLLKSSMKSAISPVFFYVPFYYWFGDSICFVFQTLWKVNVEPSSLASISGIFNLGLFLHAWLMTVIIYLTINTLKLMLKIHMMEHYSFVSGEINSLLSLIPALNYTQVPIIQKLAYLDLHTIASGKRFLRSQIFTLSQPGGHPHLWAGITVECFKLINNFIFDVDNIYRAPEPVKQPDPIPRHIHDHDTIMTERERQILSGPLPVSPTCRLRNLVDQPYINNPPPSKSPVDTIMEQFLNLLPQFQFHNYTNCVFGKLPDAEIKYLLINCECVIWASLSLADFSAKALDEDNFGIVLKDLPTIINLLLQLKSTVEKIIKLSSVKKKFQKKEHYVFMCDALKSAVRRSLYKISVAYSDYINDLPLSPDMLQEMRSFVLFREC